MKPAAALVSLLLLPAFVSSASGQGDYGDAPENVLAYPNLGINGAFPTCQAGPAGMVFHWGNPTGNAWFGPGGDLENDGNASLSCNYPPYDNDECGGPADLDAGLIVPTAYTIVNNLYATCSGVPGGQALGFTCLMAYWGSNGNVDITVTNNTQWPFFVNVIIDWDQSGFWGGSSFCPTGLTPEWVLVDLPVPPFFSGPLSSLNPPPFMIGPRSGFCWSRFTLSDKPLAGTSWDGSGNFEMGESEDYLLRIDALPPAGEFGDAPEGGPAYPPAGVAGQFPTCLGQGSANSYIYHAGPTTSWLGGGFDLETDGNAGNCAFPLYDQDECGMPQGPDVGLLRPDPYTIDALGNYQTCSPALPAPLPLGWTCLQSVWGNQFDLMLTNASSAPRYLNVLFDWNQDGQWGGSSSICTPPVAYPEQVIQDLAIPPGFSGPMSQLISGWFMVPANAGYVWTRASVTERTVGANWDGRGVFGDGETEDYLLRVDPQTSGARELRPPDDGGLALQPVWPNPASGPSMIAWSMPASGPVRVTVLDLAGRLVGTVLEETRDAGIQVASWDGRDDLGQARGSGIYFVRVEALGRSQVVKIVRAR